ncbi:hypothetical protein FQA39_LY12280 [Lamprigera yunnana]|nr:hypothetical protein FQA39_LY12280 [Lamprigera yunnana]
MSADIWRVKHEQCSEKLKYLDTKEVFKRPHTDTCCTCDNLENLIKGENDDQLAKAAKIKTELHLLQAEKAKVAKDKAKNQAKESPNNIQAI